MELEFEFVDEHYYYYPPNRIFFRVWDAECFFEIAWTVGNSWQDFIVVLLLYNSFNGRLCGLESFLSEHIEGKDESSEMKLLPREEPTSLVFDNREGVWKSVFIPFVWWFVVEAWIWVLYV